MAQQHIESCSIKMDKGHAAGSNPGPECFVLSQLRRQSINAPSLEIDLTALNQVFPFSNDNRLFLIGKRGPANRTKKADRVVFYTIPLEVISDQLFTPLSFATSTGVRSHSQ